MSGGDQRRDDRRDERRENRNDEASANLLAGIHVVSNRIGRAFASEVTARFGLRPADWRVLMSLAEEPGLTARDITRRWGMDKMAVNRAVRRLQDQGCVEVAPDPGDRRRLALHLTGEGRALFDRVEPQATRRYHEILDLLEPGERRALRRILAKLTDGTEAME